VELREIMSRFISAVKKFFTDYSPGKRCFSSLCLLITGTYLIATLYWFCGGDRFTQIIGHALYFNRKDAFPWQVFLLLLFPLLLLNYLWHLAKLFVRASWFKFILLLAAWGAASTICVIFQWWQMWLLVTLLMWAWTPLLYGRQVRRAAILHGAIFTACAGCGCGIAVLLQKHAVSDCCSGYFAIHTSGWHLVYLVWIQLILLAATVIAAGFLYSKLDNCPFKTIFSLPVKILAFLVLLTHLAMIPCALYCNAQSRKVKSELEAHFNSPLTAEAALQKFISGRKVDGDFWKRVNVLYEKTWCDRAGDYPLAEFKPEVVAAWKKKFSSSTDYAELDRMFSAPIPCPPLEHAWECGSLMGAVTSNFSSLRQVVRLQMWRIRFALETHDKAAVLQALKRINYIDEYLENEPFLIGQLVKIHINREKIEILSQVLAAKILDGSDLLELKAASRRTRAKLPELERIAVFGEALFGINYYYAILQSTKAFDGTPVIPVSTFRFLVPQLWFTAEANYLAYLKSFRNANRFHDIKALGDDSVFTRLAASLHPSFDAAGNRFALHELQLRCLEFFLDQELYYLEHKKYPTDLPFPVCSISKQPMLYQTGSFQVDQEVYEGETRQITVHGRQLIAPQKSFGKQLRVLIPQK